jgi:hypothetical protein
MRIKLQTAYFSFLILFIIHNFCFGLSMPSEQKAAKKELKKRATLIKPDKISISPDADISHIVVKFKEGSETRLRGGKLSAKAGYAVAEVEEIIRPHAASKFKRLFNKAEAELSKSKEAYERISGNQLADLNLYYRIDIQGREEAEDLINRLNKLDIVEIAYMAPIPEPAGDIDPPTPNYDTGQAYLRSAPGGVDADYANTLPGGDGSGVKIIDIEFGWNETHEDLETALGGTIVGGGGADDHGTAVLGEMIAGDNGYGVTGICPGADIGMVSVATLSVSEAILTAAENLERGDLILIELHAPGPHYNFQTRSDQLGYVCMEYWQDIFDVIQYAWAKGIIVCEAAGNGAEDFNNTAIYGQLFDTTYRNSHAIICGAGAPPSGIYGLDRSRLSFSNYGTRVDLQGYGRGVYTTGYGSLFNGGGDINQYYTATFSGTSSASPIVTASVACLQGYYKAQYGVPLDADRARAILVSTGSPQQGILTEHIGPRPNLAAALPAASAPPSLFTSPIFIDTALLHGETANIPVWLHNRSSYYGLDFAIVGNDSLQKAGIANWLDASPVSGTIMIADSILLTVTIDASLLEPSLSWYKGIIEISWGAAGGALDSSAYVPVFLTVPCAADTVFSAASSDSIGGYNWIEISTIGTVIPREAYYNASMPSTPLDDGSAGPFALPFTFPFYGVDYNQFYVGINGGISFTDAELNSQGYYSAYNIPGAPFSTFISAFWNDLVIEYLSYGHGDIYIYNSPTQDTTIIEWFRIGNFNSTADTLTTFEIILTKSGDIKFQYYSTGTTGLANTALVGVSALLCDANSFVDNGQPPAHLISDGEAVIYDQRLPKMAGDCNNSGAVNALDITYLINYLYKGSAAPIPPQAGDCNCSGAINALDITYLINYLYKGSSQPCYFIW